MADRVDHVELIFGIDAKLNSGSNGEDLYKKLWPICRLHFRISDVFTIPS